MLNIKVNILTFKTNQLTKVIDEKCSLGGKIMLNWLANVFDELTIKLDLFTFRMNQKLKILQEKSHDDK